jgi:hypothetical protein
MRAANKTLDYIGAAAIVVAFGGLFVGRVIMYPVALVPGTFLDRLAGEPTAWDISHRVMTLGAIAAIPAALSLSRVLRARSWWLVDIGTVLLIVAAALAVGQYALDYAMLIAAQLESRAAGQEFVDKLLAHPFVDLAYYEVANPAWIGVAFFAVAMWRQGAKWRPAACFILLGVLVTQFQSSMGPIGPRIALGILFLGFTAAAWRVATEPRSTLAAARDAA